MTTAQIIAEFERRTQDDHIVPVAVAREIGWTREQINHPANMQIITPEGDAGHKAKTSRDQTAIAKSDRVREGTEEFRRKVLAKTSLDAAPEPRAKPKAKIPSRPFQKTPEGMKRDFSTGRLVRK